MFIDGGLEVDDASHNDESGWVNVAVGATPTVSETAGTGTSLGDYESSISCNNGDGADPGTVITSYSIHYTKLYDLLHPSIPETIRSLSWMGWTSVTWLYQVLVQD